MVEPRAAREGDGNPALHERGHRANYAFLFVGLSLVLLVGPALDQFLPHTASDIISNLTFSGTMLIGIWSFVHSRTAFRVGIGLAAAGIVSSITEIYFDVPGLHLTRLNILLIFLLLSIWYAGRDVLFGGEINVNRIVGAACIYEMLGLIWAVMYAGIATLAPDSFSGSGLADPNLFWDFVYYSFVTLTTLGYGDISPQLPFAKSLAYMEALIGQLYIAIMVASLVGAQLSKRNRVINPPRADRD